MVSLDLKLGDNSTKNEHNCILMENIDKIFFIGVEENTTGFYIRKGVCNFQAVKIWNRTVLKTSALVLNRKAWVTRGQVLNVLVA